MVPRKAYCEVIQHCSEMNKSDLAIYTTASFVLQELFKTLTLHLNFHTLWPFSAYGTAAVQNVLSTYRVITFSSQATHTHTDLAVHDCENQ